MKDCDHQEKFLQSPTPNTLDVIFYKTLFKILKQYHVQMYFHKQAKILNIKNIEPRKSSKIKLEPFIPLLRASKLISTVLPLNLDGILCELYKTKQLKRIIFTNIGDDKLFKDMLKPIFLEVIWDRGLINNLQLILDDNDLKKAKIQVKEFKWYLEHDASDICLRNYDNILFDKKGLLMPRFKSILGDLFAESASSQPGKMSRLELAKYIESCTGEACGENDERVVSRFAKYDTDQDGYLTLQDFLTIYQGARSKERVIWDNLRAHNYNYILEKLDPQVAEKFGRYFLINQLKESSQFELNDFSRETFVVKCNSVQQFLSSLQTNLFGFIISLKFHITPCLSTTPTKLFRSEDDYISFWKNFPNLQNLHLKLSPTREDTKTRVWENTILDQVLKLESLRQLHLHMTSVPIILQGIFVRVLQMKNLESFTLEEGIWNSSDTDIQLIEESVSNIDSVEFNAADQPISLQISQSIEDFLKRLDGLKHLKMNNFSDQYLLQDKFYKEANLYERLISLTVTINSSISEMETSSGWMKDLLKISQFKKLRSFHAMIPVNDLILFNNLIKVLTRTHPLKDCSLEAKFSDDLSSLIQMSSDVSNLAVKSLLRHICSFKSRFGKIIDIVLDQDQDSLVEND